MLRHLLLSLTRVKQVCYCHACFGFCSMFMFSCLLFWSLVMVPLPSCIHAIGSFVHCVMF